MKKISQTLILTLLFVTISIGCNAQILPFSLALKGGTTSSNLRGMHSSDSKSGFNAGLSADINLPANFRIYTGIELVSKGAKNAGIAPNEYDKINALYLQVPAKLGYNFPVIPGLGLHVGVGPYFAQGIGGKIEKMGAKEKIDTFGNDTMKKFDWGVGAEVGASILGILQVRVGYDMGIANIAQSEWNGKVRNKNLYTSLGIKFF